MPQVMTLWVVQTANVAGEEARQVLHEIDFSKVKQKSDRKYLLTSLNSTRHLKNCPMIKLVRYLEEIMVYKIDIDLTTI